MRNPIKIHLNASSFSMALALLCITAHQAEAKPSQLFYTGDRYGYSPSGDSSTTASDDGTSGEPAWNDADTKMVKTLLSTTVYLTLHATDDGELAGEIELDGGGTFSIELGIPADQYDTPIKAKIPLNSIQTAQGRTDGDKEVLLYPDEIISHMVSEDAATFCAESRLILTAVSKVVIGGEVVAEPTILGLGAKGLKGGSKGCALSCDLCKEGKDCTINLGVWEIDGACETQLFPWVGWCFCACDLYPDG